MHRGGDGLVSRSYEIVRRNGRMVESCRKMLLYLPQVGRKWGRGGAGAGGSEQEFVSGGADMS